MAISRIDVASRGGATLTHAITVPQPLAWAQAAGHCPVITSDTRPGMAHEGLIGIHASQQKRPTCFDDAYLREGLGLRMSGRETSEDLLMEYSVDFWRLPRGALVGVARLAGVIRPHKVAAGQFLLYRDRAISENVPEELAARIRPWWRSSSKWGLLLARDPAPLLLPEPIPMRGAGGVWRIGKGIWAGSGRGSAPATLALEQWRKARGA